MSKFPSEAGRYLPEAEAGRDSRNDGQPLARVANRGYLPSPKGFLIGFSVSKR